MSLTMDVVGSSVLKVVVCGGGFVFGDAMFAQSFIHA